MRSASPISLLVKASRFPMRVYLEEVRLRRPAKDPPSAAPRLHDGPARLRLPSLAAVRRHLAFSPPQNATPRMSTVPTVVGFSHGQSVSSRHDGASRLQLCTEGCKPLKTGFVWSPQGSSSFGRRFLTGSALRAFLWPMWFHPTRESIGFRYPSVRWSCPLPDFRDLEKPIPRATCFAEPWPQNPRLVGSVALSLRDHTSHSSPRMVMSPLRLGIR